MQEKTSSNSNQVQIVKSKILRQILLLVGSISFAIGILGLFLPVLPTTPFLLITATCYARSSERFYYCLMNHRLFGPPLRLWRDEKSISLRSKIMAILMILVSVGSSVLFFIPILAVKVLVSLIASAVIVFLIRVPTAVSNRLKGSKYNGKLPKI